MSRSYRGFHSRWVRMVPPTFESTPRRYDKNWHREGRCKPGDRHGEGSIIHSHGLKQTEAACVGQDPLARAAAGPTRRTADTGHNLRSPTKAPRGWTHHNPVPEEAGGSLRLVRPGRLCQVSPATSLLQEGKYSVALVLDLTDGSDAEVLAFILDVTIEQWTEQNPGQKDIIWKTSKDPDQLLDHVGSLDEMLERAKRLRAKI